MLPLQPPLSHDREEERREYLDANGLPDEWQPDPEDREPYWLID